MLRLIFLGILSGAFFSATFLLNEVMSLAGGHWLWSASLRYFFMVVLLLLVLFYQGGVGRITATFVLFKQYLGFWLLAGSIGFGGFYGLLCFSADYAPAWVIAASWQFTLVASLFVLVGFGQKFPVRVWMCSLIIFLGVCLVNFSQVENFSLAALVLGSAPVLLAAFCYPLGNQLVWEAKNGTASKFLRFSIPVIRSNLLKNAFVKVFLLSLGSMPVWFILLLIIQPDLPSTGQVMNTGWVALLSGVIATSLFLYARAQAESASELAGVDATQASEVVFALLGGLVFLGASMPSLLAFMGLTLVLLGLVFFAVQGRSV